MDRMGYSSTEWPTTTTATTNTPSPIFFPAASPTPKLSSTPSKKPPSPVDWHHELLCEEKNNNHMSRSSNNPSLYKPPFTFDGDLTRPELDVLLEKLQQSTLSADTMTSSFLGDLDDDDDIDEDIQLNDDDDFFLTAGMLLSGIELSKQQDNTQQQQQQQQQISDSQQLRQWLEQLPETGLKEEQGSSVSKASHTNPQEMKRASFIKLGKQWVTRMKKAAISGNNIGIRHSK
ncbi:uncharacterized protein BX664DRAFT_330304 [Halteromyces radiatus]|uniref:uncharacterized protein n=1 Tax=Halteromyces radiatus TaxID=101107 RepID=UPI00222054B6|nr:uncharacterized protein BX664DRAFT_330304 [Halteromyces radiatus]KAI8093677.1 hypothetical protein BX664DRAFT_330304 [Halteromyces radiatus]